MKTTYGEKLMCIYLFSPFAKSNQLLLLEAKLISTFYGSADSQ